MEGKKLHSSVPQPRNRVGYSEEEIKEIFTVKELNRFYQRPTPKKIIGEKTYYRVYHIIQFLESQRPDLLVGPLDG